MISYLLNYSFFKEKFWSSLQSKFKDIKPQNIKFKLYSGESFPERANDNSSESTEIIINDKEGLAALFWNDELTVSEAYINNHLSINGNILDVLSVRHHLNPEKSTTESLYQLFLFKLPSFITPEMRSNWLKEHYTGTGDLINEFTEGALYSHGLFKEGFDSLNDGSLRKIKKSFESCDLKPGQNVLIFGGWGIDILYLSEMGINVTMITLSPNQKEHVDKLLEQNNFNHSECLLIDFYDLPDEKKYDAVLNYGVTEHLPDYEKLFRKYEKILKKDGYVWSDFCAMDQPTSRFIKKYIFPGKAECVNISSFIKIGIDNKFELLQLTNDCQDYYLTCKKWAENLENMKNEVIEKYGLKTFRIFQLYLWGCVHEFESKSSPLTAYHTVFKKEQVSTRSFEEEQASLDCQQEASENLIRDEEQLQAQIVVPSKK